MDTGPLPQNHVIRGHARRLGEVRVLLNVPLPAVFTNIAPPSPATSRPHAGHHTLGTAHWAPHRTHRATEWMSQGDGPARGSSRDAVDTVQRGHCGQKNDHGGDSREAWRHSGLRQNVRLTAAWRLPSCGTQTRRLHPQPAPPARGHPTAPSTNGNGEDSQLCEGPVVPTVTLFFG